jgi:type I restriction enzyme, R subunit
MKVDERGFEDAITASLVEQGGYRICKWGTRPQWDADFDRVRGLDVSELFAFIAETQPKAWERLVAVHGGEAGARQQFADRLAKQIDERGTVDVLRHGVNDHGIEVRLAFFKPAHGLTPELTERYLANRLTVTRQLPYEPAAA